MVGAPSIETGVDTVVVGGGQSGLAAAHQLARRGRDFVVLDAAAVPGESWRHRWDSLRLFTPAGYSHLPGMAFPARHDALATKDEMADYLVRYAEHNQIPIEHSTRVESLRRDGAAFLLSAAGRTWRASNVVAATGAHAVPCIPAFAAQLPACTAQLSSVDYRNPSQLPPGPVLVVGAGNSGAEITLDLAASTSPDGQVFLAGRDVGHVPGFGRSTALYPLMQLLGTWGAQQVSKRLSGAGDPLGRVHPSDLLQAGVARLPRVVGVRDGKPQLADGATLDVAAVVWTTGLRPDFGWIQLPVFDDAGQLRHRHGITNEPGLVVLGLPYQRTIASHLVGGVGRDAEHLIDHITRGPAP